jgi:serine/threonine-protein kinase RsbW
VKQVLVQLVIPARAEFVAVARLVVAAAAAVAPGLDEGRVADLRLAVSEACTNAMEATWRSRTAGSAARKGADRDPIQIRCLSDAKRLVVEVTDCGDGFSLDDLVTHPPVADPSRLDFERGLGIPLIRILADEVEFDSGPRGTTVRMVLDAG